MLNAITGTKLCEELAKEGVSGVVAGFTAKELLTALAVALARFQEGRPFFFKLLSACSNREWKPTGTEAGRRDDGTL